MIRNDDILGSQQLAGRVVRWHTWPMIRRPTVREHAGGVAVIYVRVWGMPRAEVLYYCLVHDDGELTAGDTPYGAKRLSVALAEGCNEAERVGLERLGVDKPQLSKEEFSKFKICDLMEMYQTARVELNMGNRYAEPALLSCREAIWKLAAEINKTKEIALWLDQNLIT